MSFKKEQLIGIAGSVIMVFGCFLPFIKVLFFSVNFIEGDGKLVIGAAIIALLFFAIAQYILGGLFATLGGLICGYDLFNAINEPLVQVEIGGFIIILGVALALVGSVLGFMNKQAPTSRTFDY